MDDRAYLLQGASYNDSLLQNYRGFHLRLQAIFVAIGTGLVLAELNAKSPTAARLAGLVLVVEAVASLIIAVQLRSIIRARGKDVDYWHFTLLHVEQDSPSGERYFTRFKIHQKIHRKEVQELEKQLSLRKLKDDEIRLLIEGGHGHTRTFLDKWLFLVFVAIWIVLLAMSAKFLLATWSG